MGQPLNPRGTDDRGGHTRSQLDSYRTPDRDVGMVCGDVAQRAGWRAIAPGEFKTKLSASTLEPKCARRSSAFFASARGELGV